MVYHYAKPCIVAPWDFDKGAKLWLELEGKPRKIRRQRKDGKLSLLENAGVVAGVFSGFAGAGAEVLTPAVVLAKTTGNPWYGLCGLLPFVVSNKIKKVRNFVKQRREYIASQPEEIQPLIKERDSQYARFVAGTMIPITAATGTSIYSAITFADDPVKVGLVMLGSFAIGIAGMFGFGMKYGKRCDELGRRIDQRMGELERLEELS